MRYHTRFRHVRGTTLTATKTLMSGWGGATEDERWTKMRTWLDAVAPTYAVPTPKLVKDQQAGAGFYRGVGNEIHMAYPSVVTLLHEFRHAMQRQLGLDRGDEDYDYEDDARAWSLSVYYAVAPRTYRRLVRSGQILFATVD